jgi:hypothetical protein
MSPSDSQPAHGYSETGLMTLPTEMRHHIYSYIFEKPESNFVHPLAILNVCRQILFECLSISELYSVLRCKLFQVP